MLLSIPANLLFSELILFLFAFRFALCVLIFSKMLGLILSICSFNERAIGLFCAVVFLNLSYSISVLYNLSSNVVRVGSFTPTVDDTIPVALSFDLIYF